MLIPWTLEREELEEFDFKVHCLCSEYSFVLLIIFFKKKVVVKFYNDGMVQAIMFAYLIY